MIVCGLFFILFWFDFWCLTPLSAIFQLYHGYLWSFWIEANMHSVFIVCLYLCYRLKSNYQEGEGLDPNYRLNTTTCLCLSQVRTWIVNIIHRGVSYVPRFNGEVTLLFICEYNKILTPPLISEYNIIKIVCLHRIITRGWACQICAFPIQL